MLTAVTTLQTTPDTATPEPGPPWPTKVVVLLREGLLPWQELNVTAFLAGAVAAGIPELIGRPYEDADGTATFVRAVHVDVVAAVGAGDAFAAGFLSATLRGLPVRDRLRHGHLAAAATLTTPGDLAPPPPRPLADRLAALDAPAWEKLRLGPGWTTADTEAAEEARTP